MKIKLIIQLMLPLFIVIYATNVIASTRAMLIFSKSGSEINSRKQLEDRELLEKNIQRLGVSQADITIIDEQHPADRKEVLQKLADYAGTLKPDDVLYIFFFGHGQAGRNDFYVSLPQGKIKGKEIATALDEIEAGQLVFCFNTQGAGLLELLPGSNRIVVSATVETGQNNPPLLPGMFLRRWNDSASIPLLELVRMAAIDTQKYGKSNNLLVNESPALMINGKKFVYPFNGISDKDLPLWAGIGKIQTTENRVATAFSPDATHAEYDAYYQQREIAIVLDRENSMLRETAVIVINNAAAAERYTVTPIQSGNVDLQVKYARAIHPDGKSIPANVISGADAQLRFAGLIPGCRLEFEYTRTDTLPEKTAAFSTEFYLSTPLPQQKFSFSISLPKRNELKFKFYNLSAPPVISSSIGNYNREYKFTADNLPPLEFIPNLPPAPMFAPLLRISAYRDWQEFADWYKQLTKNSDVVSEKLAQQTRELTADKKTKLEKLKAIYDYVCAFRYNTTPVGLRALRPRLPEVVFASGIGDCKDKANTIVAMAGAIGIKGNMVLLNRMGASDRDFPCWQFNHAIAYFPDIEEYPDGLWLDATESGTPFLTMPPGDIGRDGLIITGDGYRFGKIMPPHTSENKLMVELKTDEIRITASGLNYFYWHNTYKNLSPLQKRYAMQSYLDGVAPGIALLDLEITSTGSQEFKAVAKVEVPENATFMVPAELWKPSSLPNRPQPLLLNDGQPMLFTQIITIINAPFAAPSSWKKECENALVTVERSYSNGTEQRIFTCKLKKPLVEPAEYPEFHRMILEWLKEINSKPN